MAVAAFIISLVSLLVALTTDIRSRQRKVREELIKLLDRVDAEVHAAREGTWASTITSWPDQPKVLDKAVEELKRQAGRLKSPNGRYLLKLEQSIRKLIVTWVFLQVNLEDPQLHDAEWALNKQTFIKNLREEAEAVQKMTKSLIAASVGIDKGNPYYYARYRL